MASEGGQEVSHAGKATDIGKGTGIKSFPAEIKVVECGLSCG